MTSFQTINPATETVIKTYQEMSINEVNKIIDGTHSDYLKWRSILFAERAEKMHQVAQILTDRKEEFAELITREMGKIIKSARFEIDRCIKVCTHFANHAEEYLLPRHIKTEMSKSYVTFNPMGVVFAIMPWNFPFFQVFRFAAPGLMAGNGCILKHAPTTTGCGLMIEKIFREAGFPETI